MADGCQLFRLLKLNFFFAKVRGVENTEFRRLFRFLVTQPAGATRAVTVRKLGAEAAAIVDAAIAAGMVEVRRKRVGLRGPQTSVLILTTKGAASYWESVRPADDQVA